MARGVVFAIFTIGILSFAAFSIYDNLPKSPVYLSEDEIVPDEVAIIRYGATPVFAENLRFNHNNISFLIESSCSDKRRNSMLDAFREFEDKMGIISFYEVFVDADIEVGCSDDYISVGENLFAAGEGGPSKIINTSGFKVIEKGKISLYDDQRCDYPIVELHELLHVFGFDHTGNPSSIMYNTSKCNQRITSDMIQTIQDLYTIEPRPDILIENLSAVKRGKYLDFNITILNEGLVNVEAVKLTLIADDREFQDIDMGELGVGYGRNLEVVNSKLPSSRSEEIVFALDYDNLIEEFSESNNIRKFIISI